MIRIIKKGVGTATHAADMSKEVHDPHAREILYKKSKGMEHVLEGGESQAAGSGGTFKMRDRLQDINEYRRTMKRYKRNYERGAPVRLTGVMKDALWKKAKLLKQKIVVGMVTKKDLHPVRQVARQGTVKAVVDYGRLSATKAVQRNRVWFKNNESNLKELKRVLRVLEPNDPDVTKVVERWRPA